MECVLTANPRIVPTDPTSHPGPVISSRPRGNFSRLLHSLDVGGFTWFIYACIRRYIHVYSNVMQKINFISILMLYRLVHKDPLL